VQKNSTTAKIQDAFFILAKEIPTDQITINRLMTEAGLSRSTFYAYYENLPELIIDLENQIVTPITEIFDRYWQLPIDNPRCSEEILRYTKENAEKIYILRQIKSGNLVVKFSRAIKNHLQKRLRYFQIPYDDFQIHFSMSIMINLMIPSPVLAVDIPVSTEEIAAQVTKNTAKIFFT
jgi:AcrR family transcriptional regulator